MPEPTTAPMTRKVVSTRPIRRRNPGPESGRDAGVGAPGDSMRPILFENGCPENPFCLDRETRPVDLITYLLSTHYKTIYILFIIYCLRASACSPRQKKILIEQMEFAGESVLATKLGRAVNTISSSRRSRRQGSGGRTLVCRSRNSPFIMAALRISSQA